MAATQIIKRQEGEVSLKEDLRGAPQISFNDYGHLAVRYIITDYQDVLIVFDAETTSRIVQFCQKTLQPTFSALVRNGDPCDLPF